MQHPQKPQPNSLSSAHCHKQGRVMSDHVEVCITQWPSGLWSKNKPIGILASGTLPAPSTLTAARCTLALIFILQEFRQCSPTCCTIPTSASTTCLPWSTASWEAHPVRRNWSRKLEWRWELKISRYALLLAVFVALITGYFSWTSIIFRRFFGHLKPENWWIFLYKNWKIQAYSTILAMWHPPDGSDRHRILYRWWNQYSRICIHCRAVLWLNWQFWIVCLWRPRYVSVNACFHCLSGWVFFTFVSFFNGGVKVDAGIILRPHPSFDCFWLLLNFPFRSFFALLVRMTRKTKFTRGPFYNNPRRKFFAFSNTVILVQKSNCKHTLMVFPCE